MRRAWTGIIEHKIYRDTKKLNAWGLYPYASHGVQVITNVVYTTPREPNKASYVRVVVNDNYNPQQ